MGRDTSGSDDGDVVIVGMMAKPSMESMVPGMAVTATAFVVVATMTAFGAVAHAPLAMMVMAGAMTGSYGLRAPAMVTIGVASVVIGDQASYTILARDADRPAVQPGERL
jgi:CIC family chloride channel protein